MELSICRTTWKSAGKQFQEHGSRKQGDSGYRRFNGKACAGKENWKESWSRGSCQGISSSNNRWYQISSEATAKQQVETKSKMGKWRIFYPLHGFILDFGGKGVCCSILFCPRLSKTETGVTQSIMYGNHDLKVVVARFWSLALWTQTWLHQALGFHGNDRFRYRVITVILK